MSSGAAESLKALRGLEGADPTNKECRSVQGSVQGKFFSHKGTEKEQIPSLGWSETAWHNEVRLFRGTKLSPLGSWCLRLKPIVDEAALSAS